MYLLLPSAHAWAPTEGCENFVHLLCIRLEPTLRKKVVWLREEDWILHGTVEVHTEPSLSKSLRLADPQE